MQATLQSTGTLHLEIGNGETRLIRPSHPRYARLMALYERCADAGDVSLGTVELSAASVEDVALSGAWDEKRVKRDKRGEFARRASNPDQGDLFPEFPESVATGLDAGDTDSHNEGNEPAVSPAGPTPTPVKETPVPENKSTKHSDPDGYTLEYRDGKLHLTGPTGAKQAFSPGQISKDIPPVLAKAYKNANPGMNLRNFVHVSGTNTLLRDSVRHVAEAAYAEKTERSLAANSAARMALAKAIPGIEELKDAVSDEERYERQFARMMEDENNDGAQPPRSPKVAAADVAKKYPRAALYLKAESYAYASHDAKVAAGRRAMEILRDGGSEVEAAKVLNNWLPASAWND